MFELIYASDIQRIYIMVGALMFLIGRLFLCLAVFNDGKDNEIKHKSLWAVFSFLLGFVPAIIYAVAFNKKRKRHNNLKTAYVIIAVISIFLSLSSFFTYELSGTGEFGFLDYDIKFDDRVDVTYKNKHGRKVIIDKEGNEYTFFKKNALLYFAENGEKYRCVDEYYRHFINTETQEYYDELDYEFFINDEGYFCIFNYDNDLVYYEDEGYYLYYDENHLYYPVDYVYWDRDGNIVFPSVFNELNYLTYDEIVEN
ncbi:MAG: hypothetical protein J1E36_03305 [Eubacterium sp.]|nr:hypothetical protein [Eubacterium sp.]